MSIWLGLLIYLWDEWEANLLQDICCVGKDKKNCAHNLIIIYQNGKSVVFVKFSFLILNDNYMYM